MGFQKQPVAHILPPLNLQGVLAEGAGHVLHLEQGALAHILIVLTPQLDTCAARASISQHSNMFKKYFLI
jgi:hypothetical protein